MSKISLIIRREYFERVRKRSFLVATLLMPLLMIALMGVAGFMMSRTSTEAKYWHDVDCG